MPPQTEYFAEYYEVQQRVEALPLTSVDAVPSQGAPTFEGFVLGELSGPTQSGYAFGEVSMVANFEQQMISGDFTLRSGWAGGGGRNFGAMNVVPGPINGNSFASTWSGYDGNGNGTLNGEFRGSDAEALRATVTGTLSYTTWDYSYGFPNPVLNVLELDAVMSAER